MPKQTESRKAFESGKKAKKNGWSDLSPFYNDPVADEYFAYGYHGTKTEEELFPNPIEQQKEPELAESLAQAGAVDALVVDSVAPESVA